MGVTLNDRCWQEKHLYENDVTGIKVLLALNVSLNYLYIASRDIGDDVMNSSIVRDCRNVAVRSGIPTCISLL